MQMVVKPDGALRCLYGEEIDLHAIGKLSIERGSHVEPTNDGHWMQTCRPSMVLCSGRSVVARMR